ncbi:MAG: RdgB/HAM1 family non-canonical purine NTP pyrophosphatase [Planctomycetota bacterium]
MPEILLATKNPGKLRELREITADSPLIWHGLDVYPNIPEAVEDGSTFAENARRKALLYAAATDMYTLADDSGLQVDYLNGAPGVLSARYAGTPHDDAANNRKLLAALEGVPSAERTARFCCNMAFVRPNEILCESAGSVEGVIITAPRGDNGFGFDPLFLIPALNQTMAELPAVEKNALSHRGQALRAMLPKIEHWFQTTSP